MLRRASKVSIRVSSRHLTTSSVSFSAKFNTILNFVPTQEVYVIERFGKYTRQCEPGLNFIMPIINSIAYVQLLKEQSIAIDSQQAITVDNVVLHINGVLYLRVVDPKKASYGIENPELAITQLAQTTMRAAIGSISLDQVFKERQTLNHQIVQAINNASLEPWGIECLRYEIKDIEPPAAIQRAMEKEVEAERTKRATILESEAKKTAAINTAEGEREAIMRKANAQAEAIKMVAEAQAISLMKVGEQLKSEEGRGAASLGVAEKYIEAYGNIAKESTTMLIPKNGDDVVSGVASAMAAFSSINSNNSTPTPTANEVISALGDETNKFFQ